MSADESAFGSSGHALVDPSRQTHKTPCPDCGRTYLQGENVTWTVPAPAGGVRTVWSGCCDCWLMRTNPGGGDRD